MTRNTAFTMLELLVVTGIVAVLAGLILPAVQAARESSRRNACKNHLAQLAKGMLQHEAQLRYLPTGGWSPDWLGTGDRATSAAQPGGWTFNVLPYIEETALRDSVTRLAANDAQAAYDQLCQTPVSLFGCPSRRSAAAVPTSQLVTFKTAATNSDVTVTISRATRCDYAASGGTVGACLDGVPLNDLLKKIPPGLAAGTNKKFQFAHYPPGNPNNCNTLNLPLSAIVNGHAGHEHDHLGPCPTPGQPFQCNKLMDAVAVAPANLADGDSIRAKTTGQRIVDLADDGVPELQDGIISRMSQVRAAAVFDGMSNVYLLGEKYVAAEKYDTGTDSGDASILYAGYSASNVRWATFPPTQDGAAAERPSAFGSAHSGTWNAAFGDGSVRSMSYDIDPEVHKNLAAKAPRFSGEVLPAF